MILLGWTHIAMGEEGVYVTVYVFESKIMKEVPYRTGRVLVYVDTL
jgi:hypothetical protein